MVAMLAMESMAALATLDITHATTLDQQNITHTVNKEFDI
jgi:hypothetical protein